MTDLSELLTRLDAAATPGPWEQNGRDGIHTEIGTCIAVTHMARPDDHRKPDAELIVALRNAVPEILAALAERDDLRDELQALTTGYSAQVQHGRTHYVRAERAEAERDQLRAIVAQVSAAWTDQGISPSYHRRCKSWVWANWPTLATRVAALTEEVDQ